MIPRVSENGNSLVGGEEHLLAVPLLDAHIKIGSLLFRVGQVNSPMRCADGVSYAEPHELFLAASELDVVGLVGFGRLVSLACATCRDMIEFGLLDGGELHAENHKWILFLRFLDALDRCVQVAEELFIVEISVVGDANTAKLPFLRSFCDQLKRIFRIIRIFTVNVPVGFNDHFCVPPFDLSYFF